MGLIAESTGLGMSGLQAINDFGISYKKIKMKVLLINGSLHKDGCTYTVQNEVAGRRK